MTVEKPRLASASGHLLRAESGEEYVDLFSGHGSAWLGHADPALSRAVADQLSRAWIAPGFSHAVVDDARDAVGTFLPDTHGVKAFYSTGMEAAEFALRVVRCATGRPGIVGFERSMHGKSLATAALGWSHPLGLQPPELHRLRFPEAETQDEVLSQLESALESREVAAVFLEPVLGSGGGRVASSHFCRGVSSACSRTGTLLVFDEILTGFHRTGPAFFFSELGFAPDLVLLGKALGNGFPVSAVVAPRDLRITPEMLRGSTFAQNPLAASAVVASLRRLRELDILSRVAEIERVVRDALVPAVEAGAELDGRGALWVLSLPDGRDALDVVVAAHARGVSVGHAGSQVRILPAATIDCTALAAATGILADEVVRALSLGGGGDRV